MPSLAPPIFVALAAMSALAGCMEPLQNGGVLIIGDPSERLGAMCRFRRGDTATESYCPNDAPAVTPARVRRIAGADDTLTGPHASGRIGDYLLENGEITLVINQLGPGNRTAEGMAEGGGYIVDAADAKQRVDALDQMFTSFGTPEQQALYETIHTGTEKVGSVWLEARGHEVHEPKLRVETRYTLAASTRAVILTTTLENTGATEIAGRDLGDTVLWGGAANEVPGKERGPLGDTTAPYLFGIGDRVAYVLASDGQPFFSKNRASWSNPVFTRGATIAPAAKVSYERMFIIAPRGDTAAVATELFFLGGGAPGGIEIELVWDAKTFLLPNENRISLRKLPGTKSTTEVAPFPDPASLWLAQPTSGTLEAELAPGRYAAKLEGTAGTSKEMVVDVTSGRTTKLVLQASPPPR